MYSDCHLFYTFLSRLIVGCNNGDVKKTYVSFLFGNTRYTFFNWDSLHARLNSHYKAWSYKKKKHKKFKAYGKSI